MHALGTGSSASRTSKTELESGPSTVNPSVDGELRTPPTARPFIERRRRRPLEHAWHDALDTVHHLLLHYESSNQELRESEDTYRTLFEGAPIGIFRISTDGTPLMVNEAMAKLCGYNDPAQMLAEGLPLDEHVFSDQEKWQKLLRSVEENGVQCGFEMEMMATDETAKWILLNVRIVRESDAITCYEGTAEDITERKHAEERIRQLAYYDSVTGLPNRPLFEERLAKAIVDAESRNQGVALLLLELDRFKIINDSLGKIVGDRLLQEIAQRIRTALDDEITTARLGGAEFAIILPDVKTPSEVQQMARWLLTAVSS